MYKRIFLIVFCLIMTCFGTVSAQVSKSEMKESAIEEIDSSKVEMSTGESDYKEEPIYEEDISKYLTGEGVTMIGDSIMNGNRSLIHEQLPNALIDAKGSRDVCGGFEAAKRLETEGKLSDVVIVELGTNGPLLKHEPYASGTQNLLNILGEERQIFWVTTYCSYSQWMNMNNNFIWELSYNRPNITVIDWYSLAVNHPEWFPDGVHPNLAGARAFAKLLHDELERKFSKGAEIDQ